MQNQISCHLVSLCNFVIQVQGICFGGWYSKQARIMYVGIIRQTVHILLVHRIHKIYILYRLLYCLCIFFYHSGSHYLVCISRENILYAVLQVYPGIWNQLYILAVQLRESGFKYRI